MTSYNLATVFAPTLLYSKEGINDPIKQLTEVSNSINTIQLLIENFQQLFFRELRRQQEHEELKKLKKEQEAMQSPKLKRKPSKEKEEESFEGNRPKSHSLVQMPTRNNTKGTGTGTFYKVLIYSFQLLRLLIHLLLDLLDHLLSTNRRVILHCSLLSPKFRQQLQPTRKTMIIIRVLNILLLLQRVHLPLQSQRRHHHLHHHNT